ncbi:MAG: 50S ribosomal protein L3 [Phycisphaerae bacterium]
MIPAILGRKVGMTRIYNEAGHLIPVTVVCAEPNAITQVKTDETDGYFSVQLGFEDAKPKHTTQGIIGHCAKSGVVAKRHFREIRLKEATDKAAGATVAVSEFEGIAYVDVTGTSKGKGFQGVMKRHNFGGQPASHGVERKHRSPGSIASRATNRGFSGKPKKGIKMAGRMGNEQVTSRNHILVKVDAENNLLVIKGALPGPNGGLVFVKKSKTARVKA